MRCHVLQILSQKEYLAKSAVGLSQDFDKCSEKFLTALQQTLKSIFIPHIQLQNQKNKNGTALKLTCMNDDVLIEVKGWISYLRNQCFFQNL